jgi:lysophospholipase
MEVRFDIITTPSHRLHRFYAIPDGQPIARAILLHGYGDHAGKYLHVLSWLADHGIAASATDFRGHGRSTGRIAHVTRWEEYLDDLAAMLSTPSPAAPGQGRNDGDFEQENGERSPDDTIPTFLIAHSHGCLIAIIAALRGMLDGCSGVIMSAPFLELKMPVHWSKKLLGEIASRLYPSLRLKSGIGAAMLTHDLEFLEASKSDPYIPGVATPRWFTSARNMQAEARRLAHLFKLPLLMLVAGDDVIADANASLTFFNQAGSDDKQIKHYPKMRHELLREVGREEIFIAMLNWMTRSTSTISKNP